MGKISRLPPELANQIAAGEVIERPASVVKELMENALDAGARRISVTIELGGKQRIRVEDDGEGMDPGDARLALERHATSKLARAADLAAIATLGFRGEALPSIASVSHLVLRTRARGAESGTEIRVNGGTVASVMEAGMPEGTAIEVADLFYNLPARRKFLKSDSAEAAQISRVVTQIALGCPGAGFVLRSGARQVLQCPPAASLRDRLYQLYGERPDLVEVSKEAAGIRVTGYVASPLEQGPTRGPQNVFVNGRIVRDRTIAHAIADAYSVASIKERGPEVHLFLHLPLDRVDVNVHPTKAEVRFQEQSLVHEVVRRAVADALGRDAVPELHLRPLDHVLPGPAARTIPGVLAGGVFPSRWAPITEVFADPERRGARADGQPAAGWPAAGPPPGGLHAPDVTDAGPVPSLETPPGTDAAQRISPMIALGQFRDTFIIAVDEEGLAIIDQHVAHERILFERITERLTGGRLESQRLLDPMLMEMAASGRQALAARASDLDRFGFDFEAFGGDSLRITAVPALLPRDASEAALRALAEDLEALDGGAQVKEALRRIAATMACHAAVKANYPLTREKMMQILEDLRLTAYSTVCPHGRPVMLRLTRREIEKNFRRI